MSGAAVTSNLLSADSFFKLIGAYQSNEQSKRSHELELATAKQITGDVVSVKQNPQGESSTQAPAVKPWYMHPLALTAGGVLAVLGAVALVRSL